MQAIVSLSISLKCYSKIRGGTFLKSLLCQLLETAYFIFDMRKCLSGCVTDNLKESVSKGKRVRTGRI